MSMSRFGKKMNGCSRISALMQDRHSKSEAITPRKGQKTNTVEGSEEKKTAGMWISPAVTTPASIHSTYAPTFAQLAR